ncbi:hypothetical protein [Fischerella sp. JS2]|uniref:hypothetical protein n=1 Tax=Fischerella sp. JS2 TaxID=2597771 RepID=UPI0028EAAFBC|nr:hypothetical protein [Fischerella sp. JS2]
MRKPSRITSHSSFVKGLGRDFLGTFSPVSVSVQGLLSGSSLCLIAQAQQDFKTVLAIANCNRFL